MKQSCLLVEDEDELDDEHPKERVVVIVFVDGIQLVELDNEQDGVIVVGTQLRKAPASAIA